jgi:cytochrome c peroxidase
MGCCGHAICPAGADAAAREAESIPQKTSLTGRSKRSFMGRVSRAAVWCCLIAFSLTALTAVHAGSSFGSLEQPSDLEPEPITPLPLEVQLDRRRVDLGHRLFLDSRLSRDNSTSCGSCHGLATGGTDRRRRSIGIGGAEGDVNAPTVFNSSFNFRQFWDGRAATLEDQIEGPLTHPKEMGSTWPDVVRKLGGDRAYVMAFQALYPDGIQRANIKDAIATFERSLVTSNSRFDKFLRGDRQALTDRERAGYQRFKAYGCVSCHQGANVGGNMYQRFGVAADYFADRGNITKADLGRYNVTGLERDRYRFRVPSLRNVGVTPPYFHDGSAATLVDAVNVMAKYQLGRPLSVEDRDLIVAFLFTLTGEYEGALLR